MRGGGRRVRGIATVRTHSDLRRALGRSQRLEEVNARSQRSDTPAFIGDSPAIREVRLTIERVAASDAAVLITAEHGTGKDVVASWLHLRSDRERRAMVTVNAGGLAEGVAESELFGHVKGAFTDARADRIGCFELADAGTLFLDEDREHAGAPAGEAAAGAADRRSAARPSSSSCSST